MGGGRVGGGGEGVEGRSSTSSWSLPTVLSASGRTRLVFLLMLHKYCRKCGTKEWNGKYEEDIVRAGGIHSKGGGRHGKCVEGRHGKCVCVGGGGGRGMCGGRCGKFRGSQGRRGTFVKGHGKCGGKCGKC